MLAWERLHVLARNPIPPASSDNSLSASFPPARVAATHDSAALTRGPILDLDLYPRLPSDRRARGATSESIYDLLSFPLFFVVLGAGILPGSF